MWELFGGGANSSRSKCPRGLWKGSVSIFSITILWFSIVFLGLLSDIVSCQIHTFNLTPIPSSSQVFVDRFFVYGSKDRPHSFLWFHNEDPKVTFEKIQFGRSSTGLDTYEGVQVTLVGASVWKQHFQSMQTGLWCCPPNAKINDPKMCPRTQHLAHPSEDIFTYDVQPGTESQTKQIILEETDTYLLLISNCGSPLVSSGFLEGRVVVRNSYGYLPGIHFPKMQFYFYMSLAYMVVLGLWTGLLFWNCKNAIHFHFCIEGVIVMGLLECVMQFAYYADSNSSGSSNSVLLVMSILTAVLKNIFSYMLVLVASLGWGVTKPTLERPVIFKIQAVVLLYIVLDSIRQVTDEFIYSPQLPVAHFLLVVCCIIPISILNGIVFYWIFSSLTDLLEVLEEQKQFEKLQIFKRLLAVLVAALILFTMALFVQIYALASDVATRWQVHWWLSDGVPHLLFMLVLLVMMCLWKPNQHSRRLAYFQELPDDDELDDATPNIGSGDNVRVWGEGLDLGEASSEGDDDDDEHRAGNFDIPTHHSHPVDSSMGKERS
eukprot:GHVS01022223.1.p1 GENE.GHVS01022223.1~~GHVS01022223.1.p1  ORF type:complete len:546 (+),score=44.21 GHVS01022223.1:87-1724(+)